jgi:hypothetical protein
MAIRKRPSRLSTAAPEPRGVRESSSLRAAIFQILIVPSDAAVNQR